jgi:hypothetical protein
MMCLVYIITQDRSLVYVLLNSDRSVAELGDAIHVFHSKLPSPCGVFDFEKLLGDSSSHFSPFV